ncbi:ROK family protein [Ferdinandcohnia quinoae]|uniref:ROK family protein n=1 Tax=Fredinandcohnia quinoae TaxID=2918902 RepID=A0AAW5E574_9BACI|nr:ROK family protein [Fredinandcohnia sp. SECRCQ15]MCH1625212.1 ROK family protein [Fredinandcohnia sp. SECRCQ15]
MRLSIGIDIGGTKIAMGAVQEDGNILRKHEFPTDVARGPEYATKQIIAYTTKLIEEFPNIIGIGIGCPGPLDSKKGIVRNPPNLKSWHGYPLVQNIDSAFHLPIRLLNDADAAAFGEYYFTYRKTFKHVLFVTVSTGIGGGIIINGSLYEGALSGAGELGHSVVAPNGPICGCGKRGCLEALASGMALQRIWMQQLASAEIPFDPQWDTRDLFTQAERNEPIAVEVIDQATTNLSLGLSQAIQTLNPELLILGGGVIIGQPAFYEKVCEKLPHYLLDQHKQHLVIEKASYGTMAGVIGAAATILSNDCEMEET